MTTIVVTLAGTCADHGGSGSHLDFTISVDGVSTALNGVDISELTQPVTEDDKLTFLRLVVRAVKAGKTLNQARTALQAGVTVTL